MTPQGAVIFAVFTALILPLPLSPLSLTRYSRAIRLHNPPASRSKILPPILLRSHGMGIDLVAYCANETKVQTQSISPINKAGKHEVLSRDDKGLYFLLG